ncbi:MAG: flavin reductase family protein, partial [Candidatus Heimdallarchaeota archaeon]
MSSRIISTSDFSSKDVRKAIWEHSSSRIALVTSYWDGKHNVMTCEWFTQIQFNPPRYLIALVKGYTSVKYIEKSREFGITFLSDDQTKFSKHAGNTSGNEIDKFAEIKYPHRPGVDINPKIITGGVLALECRVIRS